MSQRRYLIYLTAAVLIVGLGAGLLFSETALEAGDENPDLTGRIAFVDVEVVFEEHPERQEAEEQLNVEAEELQAELEAEAQELEQGDQEELLREYQQKLSQREEELISGVLADIEDIITDLAQEKGLEIVLEGENVLYGGYDLTPAVMDEIEDLYESDEGDETEVEEEQEEQVD